ncbi:YqjF family protein [Halovenus rubra]|uniref:YqjF family protein n=2 Tax=Halovenus rubra TaxID=869890 RepID=A0ACC7DVI0_9EURY|nr:DUF2071 domain-containing protein [Halovenus rubra]
MPAFEMGWRDTFFASWPVDSELVTPRIPERLTVDTFDGDAYLSVVPFAIEDIRPAGFPTAVGLSTAELNLRTYVTCDGAPGIYFFTLDADDILGVIGARLFNRLPYYLADITYDGDPPVEFQSRRTTPGARATRFDARYGPARNSERFEPEPGTREHFLAERYRYFTEGSDGSIRYADIEHETWTLRQGLWETEENELFQANGFERPAGEPSLLYGDYVDVYASSSQQW